MRRRIWFFILLCTVMLLSVPASLAQTDTPLELEAADLRVTEVIPADRSTEITPRTPITVVFNRPVVPLTILEERGNLPDPLTLTPAVEGEGEWINTSIYIFRPDVAMAGGTTYTAKISGVESVDGSPVEPFSWQFTTVAPRVVELQPEPMANDIRLDNPVRITFNQPMNERSVEAAFDLANEAGNTVRGMFDWNSTSTTMTFRPADQLALDTFYTASLDAERVSPLVGDAALASGDAEWSFLTVPFPAILSVSPSDGTQGADIYSGLSIEFASPMNPQTIDERITIEPAPLEGGTVGYYSDYNNRYRMNVGYAASTTYTVTIAPGMEDVYGNRIENEITTTFTTREYRPEYSLQIPGQVGFYNAFNEQTALYIAYRNVDSVQLRLFQSSATDLVRQLTDADYDTAYGYEPGAENLLREWTLDTSNIQQNARRFDLLDLGAVAGTGGERSSCPGAMPSRLGVGDIAIVATEPDPLRARATPPDGEIVELIYRGYQLPVLDGPRCIDGLAWFQVELRDGTPVWVAEGADGEYFLDVRVAAERAPIPVTEDGALAPGVYYLRAFSDTENVSYRTPPSHFMMVSTVNVTLKYSIEEAMAWVTNVNTGEPVVNVPVQFYTTGAQAYGTATTNENGVARLSLNRLPNLREPLVGVVDTSDQFGMSADRWSDGMQPWEFGIFYDYNPDAYETYIYTDRPIYRPDEPVYFRGVVRDKRDVTYLPPQILNDVYVEIYDDQNNIIYEETLPLDEFGMYHDTIMLAEDAVLGSFYRIQVKAAPEADQRLDTLYFSVAEFRTPEFQVNVTAQQDEVVQGDEVLALVAGEYFFGGGVSNANVTYSVLAEPYRFRYEGEGRYSFIDYEPYGFRGYSYGQRRVIDGETMTDNGGEVLLELGTDLEDITGSQSYVIEATVRDETGFTVSGRTSAVVHEGLVYVGVGTDSYVSRVGEPNNVNLITVDWDSLPVADQFIDLTVERWQWNTVQEVDDSGRVVYRSEVEQTEITNETLTTGDDGRAVYEFVPEQGGVYRLVATTRDERGNIVTSSRVIWASSRNYVSWRQENDRTIDLVADADEYNVGDTARILITSPFQGESQALVTVEREGVLSSEWVTLESNSLVYELPITDAYAPNVFIGVMLVKGVDENNPVATFRYGMVRLDVETTRKVINIELMPSVEQAQPRETVTYTVRTTDYNGDPVSAQVGLNLTDLASLSVASPNSGTLLERFYGSQALSVLTSTPLTINTDEVTQNIEEVYKGGGGGGGGMGVFNIRTDFEATTYWNPQLVTDANGEATIDVTLPDNLTTWRLDARAFTIGTDSPFLVGQQTQDLISTRPLLVRPATPRFFVIGDRVMLSAVVNNNTGSEQDVTAFVEADGVTFVEENVEQVQTIPDGGRARFEWEVTVDEVENVDVTFFASADNGRFTDASKSPVGLGDDRLLPVYRFRVRETVGSAGALRNGETITEAVQLPETLEIQGGELLVNVDTSLASSTVDGLTYLRNFPHQCTEQTVSRFLPNITTYTALVELDLDQPALRANLDEQVNIGLQMLYVRQNLDGGWGWYTRDSSNPLTSAYVVFGLHQAREAGYPVEPTVLARGQQFLLDNPVLARVPEFGGGDWQYNREAFVLYALADSGSPDVARMSNLFENRERLNIEGQAFLAMALHTVQPDDERINTLMASIRSEADVSASGTFWSANDRVNWTTDTRTTAVVLEALITINPDSDLLPNVVRYLMSARRADYWETTQETAWAIMALSDWMVVSGELRPDFAFSIAVNDETLLEDTATPETVDITRELRVDVMDMLQDEANRVTISRTDGSGVMYYSTFLDAYLPVEGVEPLDNGLSIARRYVNEDGESVTSARVGEIIEVRLTVIVPSARHYVLIEDPIPAGTEAINPELEISEQIGTRPGLDRLDARRYGWGWWWFSNIEFRDEMVALYSTYLPAGTYEYVYSIRASVPGTYSVIPPIAQEFYFPDVYGRGAGETFEVLP